MIILISAALLLTFFDAFLTERPRWSAAAAYALCVAIALYTQYYLAFLIAAQALTVLVYRPRAFVDFALAAGAGALVFVPMLLVVPAQVENFRSAFTPPSSALRSGIALAGILGRYVLPLPIPHAKMIYALLVAGAGIVAAATWRSFTPDGDAPILFMTAIAFITFASALYFGGVNVLIRHAASLYLLVASAPSPSSRSSHAAAAARGARMDGSRRSSLPDRVGASVRSARETRRLDPRHGVYHLARAREPAHRRVRG